MIDNQLIMYIGQVYSRLVPIKSNVCVLSAAYWTNKLIQTIQPMYKHSIQTLKQAIDISS